MRRLHFSNITILPKPAFDLHSQRTSHAVRATEYSLDPTALVVKGRMIKTRIIEPKIETPSPRILGLKENKTWLRQI